MRNSAHRRVPAILLILVLLFTVLSLPSSSQEKKESLQKNKKQLEEEIKYTSSMLEETRKSKENSVHSVQLLTKQIEKRQALIETVNHEIGEIDTNIQAQKVQIDHLGSELKKMKEEYARMIYYAYKNLNAYNRLMFLFSAEDFNQAFRRLRYYQQYSAYRRAQAELIRRTQTEIAQKKRALETTKTEKITLVVSKEQEKNRLTVEKEQKDQAVTELSKKEKQLVATLKTKQQAASKLQKEIENLIASDIKASHGKAKTKTGAASKKSSPTPEMTLTPVEKELSSSFASNKGKLPWPSEKGVVTEAFGEHPHPVLKYVKVKNNGIDIATSKNADVRSVFNGKVSRVMSFQNLNKVVIIRHGDYLTVYSNLETVNVKDGDAVTTKQVIGKVHTNPEDSRTELHFELWQGKNLQDPQVWLAHRN
jgi:murein hydrolase activator